MEQGEMQQLISSKSVSRMSMATGSLVGEFMRQRCFPRKEFVLKLFFFSIFDGSEV